MATKELLHELFDYKDGVLYWKLDRANGKVKAGDVAGSKKPDGRIIISINHKMYKAHRLIFLYHHGRLPKLVDHDDNNNLNNRIENLRDATKGQNAYNSKLSKANKSGVKGVFWYKRDSKWKVKLRVNGKSKDFGTYFDIDYAKFVADAMRYKYHGNFANHG